MKIKQSLVFLWKLACSDLHQSKKVSKQVEQVELLVAWSITKPFFVKGIPALKWIVVLLRVNRSFEYISSRIVHPFPYHGYPGWWSNKKDGIKDILGIGNAHLMFADQNVNY